MAKREKKPIHKVVMTEGKRNIIQQLFQEYDIETTEDIQDALKDLLGGTIREIDVPQDRKSTFEPQIVKNVKKISLISTGKLYLCMQKE